MQTLRLLLLMPLLTFAWAGYLAAQPNRLPATHEKDKAKAVVVGVSHYQDADMPDLKFAHHDAEAFAAFLMSPGGGGLSQHDIVLLTNDQATSARFAAALDWLFEQSEGSSAIIYFAGYGGVLSGSEAFPNYFLLNDSPLSPISAGAFNFPAFFQYHVAKRKQQFTIFANAYPLVLPPDLLSAHVLRNYRPSKSAIVPDAVKNTVAPTTVQAPPHEDASFKISLNNLLLDGLLGLADRNGNGQVTMRELARFLKAQPVPSETWPSQLSVSFDEGSDVAAVVDEQLLKKLSEHSGGNFHSLVLSETSPSEEALLSQVGERERVFYRDFVVAIKLGHLLEPAERSAANLYDSLVQVQALKPLHGSLRRKLAAALQDEAQQALNAYLRTDIREIVRRGKDERYRLYPRYLELALELLGEKHFMQPMLLAKQHYFEGLLLRFDGEKNDAAAALLLALQKQQLALGFAPDAAFIVNEVGVIYALMGRLTEAIGQFQNAAELAPNWSIPYSNLCFAMSKTGDYMAAIEHGKQAVRLSPRNVVAINNLGTAQLENGYKADAEQTFVHATSIDPSYPQSYYNLACLKALQGLPEQALGWLEQALVKGFDDEKALRNDADLTGVRQLPNFENLVRQYFAGK